MEQDGRHARIFLTRFHMGPSVSLFNGFTQLKKMVKTFKNLLCRNQESFETESWYIALGTQGLPNLFI